MRVSRCCHVAAISVFFGQKSECFHLKNSKKLTHKHAISNKSFHLARIHKQRKTDIKSAMQSSRSFLALLQNNCIALF